MLGIGYLEIITRNNVEYISVYLAKEKQLTSLVYTKHNEELIATLF